MSGSYRWVQWNRHKVIYDLLLVGVVVSCLAAWIGIGMAAAEVADTATLFRLLIAATGTTAITLLHVVLLIGPLARLDRRFCPLLYNRRHLGVVTFLVALLHALAVLFWYGAFGAAGPWAVFTGPAVFPLLGLGALAVLFVMAATSHDFWLKNLSPSVWKALHMGVYGAWVLVVAHVLLGALRDRPEVVPIMLVLGGGLAVTTLHVLAGWRERREPAPRAGDGWVDVAGAAELRDGHGRVVVLPGAERIAIFRDGDRVHAVSNVCAHQAGPLGEGRIVDGCITCPWHGYQYRPADGCSPPPFTERIATYEVRVRDGRVQVDPNARAPGSPIEGARIGTDVGDPEESAR